MCEDVTSATAPTMAIMRAAPTMEVRRACGTKEVNPHVEKLCLCPPRGENMKNKRCSAPLRANRTPSYRCTQSSRASHLLLALRVLAIDVEHVRRRKNDLNHRADPRTSCLPSAGPGFFLSWAYVVDVAWWQEGSLPLCLQGGHSSLPSQPTPPPPSASSFLIPVAWGNPSIRRASRKCSSKSFSTGMRLCSTGTMSFDPAVDIMMPPLPDGRTNEGDPAALHRFRQHAATARTKDGVGLTPRCCKAD